MSRIAMEAERSLLSSLMHKPLAVQTLRLTGDDFIYRQYRELFNAIASLVDSGKTPDAVMLMAEYPSNVDVILEVSAEAWTSANLNHYAEIVKNASLSRRMTEVLDDTAKNLNDGQSPIELLDTVIRGLMALNTTSESHEYDMKSMLKMAMSDIEYAYDNKGTIQGVPTGYKKIDARLGGFHKGDLILLGARPSMGKTALMVNLALNATKSGCSVGLISGEQPANQIGKRNYALVGSVSAEHLRNGNIEDDEWSRLTSATSEMFNANVRVYDRPDPTLDEVIRIARRWKQEHGINILFVDYLQRIRYRKANNRIDEVSEVARSLKTLARDLDIPVVALAQVKGEVDKRTGDKRPNLGDIANSDEATREADQIMFLYRDEVYSPESQARGIAELNVEKNRHGATGRFDLRFVHETMTFKDLEWTR